MSRPRRSPLALLLLLALAAPAVAQNAPGAHGPPLAVRPMAPTPPMGWNSWNKFGCQIDEALIRETADAMVAHGMKAAGYRYVNIDDCWMAKARDAAGNLQPDPVRFPHGIKALADYVHSKGLKLGIYSSAGTATCQNFPASLDHETADATTFAAWGVDYLKYDNCNNEKRPALARYRAMGLALRATNRPMVFSLCEWGENHPWHWGREVGGNLWRTTGDIEDKWPSVLKILDRQDSIARFAGPNGWNDPDMLEVGNGGMSDTEYRAHFSLWALLNAPLIAGNDLRSMSPATRAILTNRDVIAVDQDWGGRQGSRLKREGDLEVWSKPMKDGGRAVVLLSRGDGGQIGVTMQELGLPRRSGGYVARELWTHASEPVTAAAELHAGLSGHSVLMFLVEPAGARGGR